MICTNVMPSSKRKREYVPCFISLIFKQPLVLDKFSSRMAHTKTKMCSGIFFSTPWKGKWPEGWIGAAFCHGRNEQQRNANKFKIQELTDCFVSSNGNHSHIYFLKFRHTLSVKVALSNWLDCRPFAVKRSQCSNRWPGIGIGHKHSSGMPLNLWIYYLYAWQVFLGTYCYVNEQVQMELSLQKGMSSSEDPGRSSIWCLHMPVSTGVLGQF